MSASIDITVDPAQITTPVGVICCFDHPSPYPKTLRFDDKSPHYLSSLVQFVDNNDESKGIKLHFPYSDGDNGRTWMDMMGTLCWSHYTFLQKTAAGEVIPPILRCCKTLWDNIPVARKNYFIGLWTRTHIKFLKTKIDYPSEKLDIDVPEILIPIPGNEDMFEPLLEELMARLKGGMIDVNHNAAFTAGLLCSMSTSSFYLQEATRLDKGIKCVYVHHSETFRTLLGFPATTVTVKALTSQEKLMHTLIWLVAMGKQLPKNKRTPIAPYYRKRYEAMATSAGINDPKQVDVFLNLEQIGKIERLWGVALDLRTSIIRGLLKTSGDSNVPILQRSLADQILMICRGSGMRTVNLIGNFVANENSTVLGHATILKEIKAFTANYKQATDGLIPADIPYMRLLGKDMTLLKMATYPNLGYCAIVRAIASGSTTMSDYEYRHQPTVPQDMLITMMNEQFEPVSGKAQIYVEDDAKQFLIDRGLDPTKTRPTRTAPVQKYVPPPKAPRP